MFQAYGTSRQVVYSKRRMRWCPKHGADPNAQNKRNSRTLDIPDYATRIAPFPVLERLSISYEADLCNYNPLYCAAEGARVDIMQWLLNNQGFTINQRGLE